MKEFSINLRLFTYLYRIRRTIWFIPGVMLVAAVLLFLITTYVDVYLARTFTPNNWFNQMQAEGTRGLLATISASFLGLAGVAFSITIVVLSLASQQFGPRILDNFMRDNQTQAVLGMFLGTHLFALLVLQSIGKEWVPEISVYAALILAAISLACFVYYIDHVAQSIQASNIIGGIGGSVESTVRRIFPEELEHLQNASPPDLSKEADYTLLSKKPGYIQAIDYTKLIHIARRNGGCIYRVIRPGKFSYRDTVLCRVSGFDPTHEEMEELLAAFKIGQTKTHEQDVEFGISQLVQIALRGVSPGINDPVTAIRALDQLGSALRLAAQRHAPPTLLFDEDKTLRVVRDSWTFSDVADGSLNQLRQAPSAGIDVAMRMLEVIDVAMAACLNDERRELLVDHARMVYKAGVKKCDEKSDRAGLDERVIRVCGPDACDVVEEGNG